MQTYANAIIILFSLLILQKTSSTTAQKERSKRFIPVLVFPPTSPTRVQFIAGIGIPLEDLRFEALTTGYVFKAEYFLPTTAEELRTTTYLPLTVKVEPSVFEKQDFRSSNKRPLFESFLVQPNELRNTTKKWLHNNRAVLSNYRWTLYAALEGLANNLGLNGRECVLKSICEIAEEPFHYTNGLYAQILHVLLLPSTSADRISQHTDNEYFYAENIGRSGDSCAHVFKDCPRSLLSHVSQLHSLAEQFGNLFT